MLITADWVLPILTSPIRRGAVLVRNGLIAEVGPAEELAAQHPDVPRHDHPGCVAMPGLVNAHTHLALTCLDGLLPPQPFAEWIRRIPVAVRALDRDDMAASTALGAALCLRAGVTLVGEIAYGPESVAVAADAGLGGRFFWEVLGIPAARLGATLEAMEFPADDRSCTARRQCGLSPHAPYTSGPDLLRMTHRVARARDIGYAVHVAESEAEVELLATGDGPLAEVATRLAAGFKPSAQSPVAYLDELGVLEGLLAVHCTKVLSVDIPKLARKAAGVVLCPRSNEYLQNGTAPIAALARSGIALGLGTDSSASNVDLDLFEEARALARIAPELSAERIVRMMTLEGAAALGMDGAFGALARGYQADIAVFRVPAEEADGDPHTALLGSAGRHALEALLTAGVWRVLHGQPTLPVSFVERGARLAAAKAAVALGE